VTSAAARETAAALSMRMTISKLNFFYGSKQVLFDINMGIATNKVTSLIGPSGCGKSTLLRTLNRMHEAVRNARLEGEILLDGQNIFTQTLPRIAAASAWSFSVPIHSPSRFLTTLPMACGSTARMFPSPMRSKKAFGVRRSGTK